MLQKNTKTSQGLKIAEPVDIAAIMREVKQHGFYSAYCDSFAHGAGSHNELILMIRMLAKNAHLTVSFNAIESICIFEAFVD